MELDHTKNTKIYETQLEKVKRNQRFKMDKELKLSDYTQGASDHQGVANYFHDVHKQA